MSLLSLSTPSVIALLAAASLLAASAASQQVRAIAPIGLAAPQAPATNSGDDPGTTVDMYENSNLDRYLRRAQGRLEREDFATAIELLQQVVEGRTSEVVETKPEGGTPTGETPRIPELTPQPAPEAAPRQLVGQRVGPGGAAGQKPEAKQPELDARNSVFSQDGRLYRPVRRLCHEMLARMPTVGLEIYRANHEVAADELLQAALQDGSLVALEQVSNRYFITMPAGRAMALLADRLMHEGRYRAAVLVLRDLLDIYPVDNRKRLGISDVWCHFKIALCLRLAGEAQTAHEAVVALAAKAPEESLRVLGELHAVKDLPADALFARDVAAVASLTGIAKASFVEQPDGDLLPLWQFRFRNPEPYKEPKPTNNDRNVFSFDQGMTAGVMPFAGRYGPATWVTFAGADANGLPQALFLEHFRLRVADATSGLLLAQGDRTDEPPPPREQHPRVRVAASDFALLRTVDDGERRYVMVGHPRATTSSVEPLKSSELVAYRADTTQVVWSSTQWGDGEAGLRDVTFLAAPTVFGERLLLPSLRKGRYSLECLERQTGRPLWNAQLHGGGTKFFKAPGCQVVVLGGVAFVATNAGCIASVDAFTGDLRWIRRYERQDPLRKHAKVKRASRDQDMMGFQGQFLQDELPGFHPNDLIVQNGLVIAAPCDSNMLLCLDGATGEPHWMLDATTRYAPYGTLRGLIGCIGDDLFATSDTHVVAIGASGGLVKWARELPAWNGPKHSGRGRGTIAGNRVLIPGEREVLVFGSDGELVRRLPLPAFDASREPLAGSSTLVAHGPFLAIGYQGGVEVFSSAAALRQLADTVADTRRKCELLVRAGAHDTAVELLTAAMRATNEAGMRRALGADLLAIARERAEAVATQGDVTASLQLLDSLADLLRDPEVRLAWHLVRVEICKEHGDLRGHEQEQNRLYAYMEGKG